VRYYLAALLQTFPLNVTVKRFWKSVSIWRRYKQKFESNFLGCPINKNTYLSTNLFWMTPTEVTALPALGRPCWRLVFVDWARHDRQGPRTQGSVDSGLSHYIWQADVARCPGLDQCDRHRLDAVRPSCPAWVLLVTYRDGLATHRLSPIRVLTGLGVSKRHYTIDTESM